MKNANPVSLLLAAACLLLGGCRPETSATPAAPAGAVSTASPKTAADWFELRVGDRDVRVQLAVRPAEMERGLMGRRDLGAEEGMLFIYPAPSSVSFWMKNTPTPLDIAYFTADGALAEVYPAFPFDEKTLPSRSDRIQFVLEMHQGWYARRGLKPGARLDLAQVASALRARGFDPAAYGLGGR